MSAPTIATSIHADRERMGAAAAHDLAAEIQRVHRAQGRVRIVFAAAPSQSAMLAALRQHDLPWGDIDAFHMDEYLGLAADHPARFGSWLNRHLFDHVALGSVHLMHPDTGNPQDYAAALASAPLDITCLGIGVNGHLAFNDPPVADFSDPVAIKVVELDQPCRQQQVDDECFATLDDVPTHAWTLTIPRLLDAGALFCVVPGTSKAAAVRDALDGPLDPACPASALRTHPRARLYLDSDAASLLS